MASADLGMLLCTSYELKTYQTSYPKIVALEPSAGTGIGLEEVLLLSSIIKLQPWSLKFILDFPCCQRFLSLLPRSSGGRHASCTFRKRRSSHHPQYAFSHRSSSEPNRYPHTFCICLVPVHAKERSHRHDNSPPTATLRRSYFNLIPLLSLNTLSASFLRSRTIPSLFLPVNHSLLS